MSKTKKSLVLSCLSMLLCVTMLIGSTFAWFTDTASTGVNTIQAGTLDIGLYEMPESGAFNYAELDNYTSLEQEKLTFRDKNGNENILWEPGATFMTQEFIIVNEGNLEAKMTININGMDATDKKLLDAIDFTFEACAFGDYKDENALWMSLDHPALMYSGEFTLNPHQASSVMRVTAEMKETAGNEYQGLTLDGIGITVQATQAAKEYDSFDNQYDKDADFTDVEWVEKATNEAFAAAISSVEDGGTVVLPAGEYTIPTSAGGKEFTISGTKDTVVKIDTVNTNAGGADVTFKGVTIKGQESGNYAGLGNGCNVSFVDCTINGKISLYGEKASFVNCTFNNKNDYSVWTWGGKDVDFIGCTFNSGGKALLVYGEYVQTNIDIIDCTFNDDDTLDTDKAAIEIGSDRDTDTHNINIENVTVSGFSAGKNTGSTTWANKNNMPKERLNVVIDGVDVH